MYSLINKKNKKINIWFGIVAIVGQLLNYEYIHIHIHNSSLKK